MLYSTTFSIVPDCQTVWDPVRGDVGEDPDGRGRRVLHAGARDKEGQDKGQALPQGRVARPRALQVPVAVLHPVGRISTEGHPPPDDLRWFAYYTN